MEIWKIIISFVSAYLFGAIPFGYIVVKAFSGKDVRQEGSGRTGGTNAGRAAGFKAGALTGILDFFKAALAVWLPQFLIPNTPWVAALAGLIAIAGHNYSIHLLERDADGFITLRGGAGGAPCLGAACGLFFPNLFIILPIAMVALFVIGYASIATLSISFLAALVFAIRAALGLGPWEYVGYGIGAIVLLIIALKPNLIRLKNGTERMIGLRVWLRKRKNQDK